MTGDLSRLLRPRSIAVIGGGAWCANVVRECVRIGFDGPIWPVHPKREQIGGLPCFPTLESLPQAPDAAFIGINRSASVEAVRVLSARGAGGAVCFASGFREVADGQALQQALLDAAAEMPFLGPNCYGFVNALDGAALWPDQHGCIRAERGVAILTQSSNIALNLTMQARALPLAYVITAGNQAQTGLAQIASSLLDDERVTALGLHIEGVGDIAAFAAMAAKARERRIPVVAITVGRSDAARIAAVSHTASLAGAEAGTRAFFRRLGIPRIESLSAFMETLKLLHLFGPLPGRDLLSVSCSGGEASLMADTVLAHDLRFRPFEAAEGNAVRETLNDFVRISNPLDYHTFIWDDEAALTRCFSAAMRPGFDLSCFVLDFPRRDRCDPESWEPTVRAIASAVRETGGRAVVVASLPETVDESRAETLMQAGIVPLLGIPETLIAAEAAAEIGEAWAAPSSLPVSTMPTVEGTPVILDEAESKTRLEQFGLQCPPRGVARDAATAARIAGELESGVSRFAVKALGLAHKSEAGAVMLGLRAEEVEGACARMLRDHGAVLVESMVEGGIAELILGVTRDPVYGLLLTIGAGGILTELLDDSATLLLPTDASEIGAALDSLKCARLLAGYRGKPAADRDATIAAALAVAEFAVAHADRLEELDVNPLIVCEEGALAVDALIRWRDPQ